jgi:heavy metal sensor kinase
MKSLHAKLLASFAVLLGAVLTLAGVLAYRVAATRQADDVTRIAKDKAVIYSKWVNIYAPQFDELATKKMEAQKQGFYLALFGPEGERLGQSRNCPLELQLSPATRAQAEPLEAPIVENVVAGSGDTLCTATYPVVSWRGQGRQTVAWAMAAVPLNALDTRLAGLKMWMLAGGSTVWILSILMLFYFSRQWQRSLRVVAEMAGHIDTRNLTKQRLFVPSEDPEVARLARTFNDLLDRLEQAYKTEQRFVADASHELRTPLTILRGEIEVALRKSRSAEDYAEVLKSSKEEIERMSRLVENLLALAHADAGEAIAKRQTVDVALLSRQVCKKLQPLADQKKIAVHIDATEPAEVSGDAVALDRVISNLVENAIRYSPEGEQVNVRTESNGAHVKIEVSDTGEGIHAEHVPQIFDRFYRVDKARSRDFGGAGLGLSIVKAMVEAHGGRIEAHSELGQGSTFTVWLPRS